MHECPVRFLRDKQLQRCQARLPRGLKIALRTATVLGLSLALMLEIRYRQGTHLPVGSMTAAFAFQFLIMGLTFRLLHASALFSELRSRRILPELLGTRLTVPRLVDRMAALAFRDALMVVSVPALLGLALAPLYLGWAGMGMIVFEAFALLFSTAFGIYGVQMVFCWGDGLRQYATGLVVALALMLAPMFLVMMSSFLGLDHWLLLPIGFSLICLPLLFRGLCIWRLNRLDPPVSTPRTGRCFHWGRIQEWLARRNLVVAHLWARLPWPLLAILSLAIPLGASPSRGPFAVLAREGFPWVGIVAFLGLIYAFVVSHSAVRKVVSDGGLEIWQQAGVRTAEIVDGFALWASAPPLWILLLLQPFLLGTSGMGACSSFLWATTIIATAAYSGIYAARGVSDDSLVLAGPIVVLLIAGAVTPKPLMMASQAIQSFILLGFIWYFRTRALAAYRLPIGTGDLWKPR